MLGHGEDYIQAYLIPSEYAQLNYIHDTYANIPRYLKPHSVDFILLDLGINREHITDPDR